MQPLLRDPTPAPRHDFAAVYRAHHDFVRRTLRHLGVDADRIDDALQDTFLVVFRRLAEFEGRAALRTWIFEIARRVAGRYRRTAAREAPRRCELPEVEVAPRLEDDLARAEAAEILREFLEELDPEKSVIFIMAELEQRRAPEIADALAVNLNTVYARLRAARQQLDRLVHRLQAREERPRVRRAAEVIAAALLVEAPATAKAWSPGQVEIDALPDLGRAAHVAAPGSAGGGWAIAVGLALCGVLALPAPEAPARPAAEVDAPTSAQGVQAPGEGREPAAAVVDAPDERGPVRGPSRGERGSGVVSGAPDERGPEPVAEPAGAVVAAPRTRLARREGPGDALARELALFEPARAALLAGDARRALRLLARHRRQFPAGVFAQEAAATRIEALCRLGDRDGARRETAAFTRRWPGSNLSGWVVSLCDG